MTQIRTVQREDQGILILCDYLESGVLLRSAEEACRVVTRARKRAG